MRTPKFFETFPDAKRELVIHPIGALDIPFNQFDLVSIAAEVIDCGPLGWCMDSALHEDDFWDIVMDHYYPAD